MDIPVCHQNPPVQAEAGGNQGQTVLLSFQHGNAAGIVDFSLFQHCFQLRNGSRHEHGLPPHGSIQGAGQIRGQPGNHAVPAGIGKRRAGALHTHPQRILLRPGRRSGGRGAHGGKTHRETEKQTDQAPACAETGTRAKPHTRHVRHITEDTARHMRTHII